MNNKIKLPFVLLTAITLMACGIFTVNPDVKSITPSDKIITENREVSNFTGVDISSIGTVTISQGEKEALVITGSDNLVDLVKTNVQNGVLNIDMEMVSIRSLEKKDILTFEITVKDLDSLTVSGVGTVEMNGLKTKSLDLVMSGAGAIKMDDIAVETVTVDISGVGGITVAGTANQLKAELSGAGELNANDLETKTANVNISGIGTATVWVTDELTGEISGAGSVRYYGDPKTNTNSSGVGRFESLGNK